MKNLVLPIFAFFLVVFASCSKPTVNKVSGNWCMTDYKSVESNESSDTTIETSFIDADWQQTTYANGQQEKVEGKINYNIPSLILNSDGTFSKRCKYYYHTESKDSIIYVSQNTTGIWQFYQRQDVKGIDAIALCINEEKISNKVVIKVEDPDTVAYVCVSDTLSVNRYAKDEKYIVYNFDEYSNKKIVLNTYKSSHKINECITLDRITDKNKEKIANKYGLNIVGHLDD